MEERDRLAGNNKRRRDRILQGIRKHPWIAALAVICLLLFLFPPIVCMELRVNYTDMEYEKGAKLEVLTSPWEDRILPSGLQVTCARRGQSRIRFLDPLYWKGCYVRRLDPLNSDAQPIVRIRSIEVYCNGKYGGAWSGQALYEAFTCNEQAQIRLDEEGQLEVSILGGDSQLFPTQGFQSLYRETALQYARLGVLYLVLCGAAVLFLSLVLGRIQKSLQEERILDMTDAVLWLAAAGAIALLVCAVFTGDTRKNPDEWESRDAIRYYTEHSLPPDIRDPEVAPTVGTYGTTRLAEWNPYDFYGGKLAALVSVEHVERLFGLLLGIGLFLFVLIQARKNRYLLAVCFLSPQIWYLYAYCTSDALDYLVSVIVLYQLAAPCSMLNGLIRRGVSRRETWRLLLLGTLFAHVMMAKANFYVILIYAFLVLLEPLCQAEAAEKKRLLRTYLWIAGVSLAIFGIRLGFDVAYYGIHKRAVVLELQDKLGIYSLRPSTPPAEQDPYFRMYNKGVSFWTFLTGYGLHHMLFRSSVGVYGGMLVQGRDWYYLAMGALYLLLYAGTAKAVFKGRRKSWLLLHVSALASYLLVLYNGYFEDFQAQGRYILPVFILMAHGISLDEKLTRRRWFNVLVAVTAVLSLYSFGVGIPQLREL